MSGFTLEERVVALETLVNALIASLGDAGSLPAGTFLQHLCRATNELEGSGLAPGSIALLDEIRKQAGGLFPGP